MRRKTEREGRSKPSLFDSKTSDNKSVRRKPSWLRNRRFERKPLVYNWQKSRTRIGATSSVLCDFLFDIGITPLSRKSEGYASYSVGGDQDPKQVMASRHQNKLRKRFTIKTERIPSPTELESLRDQLKTYCAENGFELRALYTQIWLGSYIREGAVRMAIWDLQG